MTVVKYWSQHENTISLNVKLNLATEYQGKHRYEYIPIALLMTIKNSGALNQTQSIKIGIPA
jgi:hypothetical protein